MPTAIVGLGSSAGGLDALRRFFNSMPSDSGMAFVLVQHLDPMHPSQIAALLGRCTAMSVVQVDADTPVEADHVYCMPPGRYLSISGRTLRLTEPVETGSVRMPIDFFLRSLGTDAQERGIGIVLSGTGTDGTLGLRAIKAAGGLAIAQDPATAEYDGMPRSAIADGAIDHVLSPEQMPDVLLEDLFAVVSKHWRIYRRIGATRYDKVRFPVMEEPALGRRVGPSPGHPGIRRLGALAEQLLRERFVPACVLINRKSEVPYFAGPTHEYLVQPTGVPTQDLMLRLRDGLPTKLRGAIRRAFREGERPVVITAPVLARRRVAPGDGHGGAAHGKRRDGGVPADFLRGRTPDDVSRAPVREFGR